VDLCVDNHIIDNGFFKDLDDVFGSADAAAFFGHHIKDIPEACPALERDVAFTHAKNPPPAPLKFPEVFSNNLLTAY
jgi:hypothetical protein